MDADLRPVPIWAPGEIFVGGDNVTRGYLNRPDPTAEKFVPDPYSQQPGERLFKTGDLARYLPDGVIEFLGRKDHQVKIRGFRVEPGEIEFALGSHPDVDEIIVTVREDSPGKETLVAYIVSRQRPAPTAEELRYFLKEKLPDHLIPSAFVTLEGIPLTPNGKIDRKALPPPDKTNRRNFAPPRNPIEHALARLWAEVLGVEQVGVHDNFFELGGHSLLGIQLLSRVQDSFQVELPLVLMFESPTVADLAEELAKHEEIPGQMERVAAILQEVEGMDAKVMEETL
jgi:acyl carrier protein